MDQERTEKPVLEGTVSSIIFQNEENGYTILRLDAGEEEMTVVGSMPGVSPGEYLTVRGEWVRHATYGTQFRADVVERRLPQGLKEVYHYLASGAVKGVGKATARLLVEDVIEGRELPFVMTQNPSLWRMVPKAVAFKYTPKSYHKQMRDLIRAGADHHSLVYEGDASLKRRLRVWKNHLGNIKRFGKYNKVPTED